MKAESSVGRFESSGVVYEPVKQCSEQSSFDELDALSVQVVPQADGRPEQLQE